MKKLVIFDLDGTLLNTIEDLADGVNHVMKLYGYPAYTVEEVTGFVGNGIGNLIARVLPGGRENPEFDKVYEDFMSFYSENSMVKTCPYAGTRELLGELVSRGIDCAIVSNKVDSEVKRLAEHFFPGLVKAAVGERDDIKRKPAPDSALEVLRSVGAKAEDALYVGDSDVDIKTAAAAGVEFVAVDWGFRSREFLIENGTEKIISKPNDLLKYIK